MSQMSYPFQGGSGPQMSCPELVTAWLEGADAGSCPALFVESDCIHAAQWGDVVAIRLAGAVLLRDDLPGDALEARGQVTEVLATHGLGAVEHDPALGQVVGIEVGGLRGAVWELWAHDREQGREVLQQRALGAELAEQLDLAPLEERRRIDEAIGEIERRLHDDGAPDA